MQKANFTIDQLIQEVRNLAAESPHNRYHNRGGACFYSKLLCDNGAIGCIFGQAFQRLDIDVEEIDNHADAEDFDGYGSSIDRVIPKLGIEADSFELSWCKKVQTAQDNDKTWASAIEEADSEFPLNDTENQNV